MKKWLIFLTLVNVYIEDKIEIGEVLEDHNAVIMYEHGDISKEKVSKDEVKEDE